MRSGLAGVRSRCLRPPGDVSPSPFFEQEDSMHLLIVQHRVEDYDRFKAVFDAHPPTRGGATQYQVGRNVDDPADITIVASFDSLDQAVAWRDDPELLAAVAGAGVIGEPQVGIFERVDAPELD
jgi:hypothetical protein